MPGKNNFSRRKFLQYGGALTGAAAALGLSSLAPEGAGAAEAAQSADNHAAHAAASGKPLYRARMFLTNDTEFFNLSEASERIFPKDDTGPGAKELAVPYFIDNQMAGGWGYNTREYTGGPFFPGAPTQGYQTPLVRNELIKQGLQALNDAAQERFKQDFHKLGDEQMDQILADCEKGRLPTRGFSSDFFFGVFKDAVLGGVYSDPMYNGNNNMDGWRLKDYPGAQMSYAYLMSSEKFEKVEPMSLSSMQ